MEEKKLNEKELKDEELEKVAGGYDMWKPGKGKYDPMLYRFTAEEVKKLLTYGIKLEPNRVYNMYEVISIFKIDSKASLGIEPEVNEGIVESILRNNFGLKGRRYK